MPKPCQLKEFDGGMWARLDIDWDGGSVSLYTPIEIKELIEKERKHIMYIIQNIDRVTIESEY